MAPRYLCIYSDNCKHKRTGEVELTHIKTWLRVSHFTIVTSFISDSSTKKNIFLSSFFSHMETEAKKG